MLPWTTGFRMIAFDFSIDVVIVLSLLATGVWLAFVRAELVAACESGVGGDEEGSGGECNPGHLGYS
ncbi:hypothetical protein [Mesorhizobium sp. B2-6-1]|uniref:hypothetical protein n=1 Tax=Mesorhizobium sp. B2-6-1 TaxID=2589916 RepID=UPI0015E315BB